MPALPTLSSPSRCRILHALHEPAQAHEIPGRSGVADEQHISLTPVLLVNFIGTMGFSIVLPFLVFLVAKWGGNAIIYGALAATYSFFQLIGAPILGRWSDRYGRRRILLLSQLGTLASWVVFLIAFALPVTALAERGSSSRL